jgi:hypothetical protein
MTPNEWLGLAMSAIARGESGRQDAVNALRALAARIERGELPTLIEYDLSFRAGDPDAHE